MAYTDKVDARNFQSWEYDPSTRDSMHLLTKPYPVDVTLATAGTAEDLIAVSPGVATVNMITNPSAETSDPPTGFTAVGSTLARDGTYYRTDGPGSYSLKVTPDNSAKGEGAYWEIGPFPKNVPLACSAYFRRGAAGSGNVRCELWASSITSDTFSTISNVRAVIGTTAALGATMVRSTLVKPKDHVVYVFHITGASGTFTEDETITGGTSGATARIVNLDTKNRFFVCDSLSATEFSTEDGTPTTETLTGGDSTETATLQRIEKIVLNGNTLRLYFVTNTNIATVFYVDDMQAETLDQVTDYCDGAVGAYNWWDGTANASESRRWVKLSCIRDARLHATRDCYVAYDCDANSSGTNPEDKGEYIRAGTDFGFNHPIYLKTGINFVNVLSGEQPRVYGIVRGI